MLKWLLNSGIRESWSRYSVTVYLGLLLAGTLSAEPPRPPEPAFDAQSRHEPPAWLAPVRESPGPEPRSDPLRRVEQW